jgi:hypothetical protein
MVEKLREKMSKFVKDPRLDRLELFLRKTNFFYIINCQNLEIRHSNFLAWLLNPKENHGFGDYFLKRFLKDIFSNRTVTWIDEFDIDQINFEDVEIKREWNNIDILIKTKDFIICIENKMKSREHSNQLQKYKKILETKFPKQPHQAFVYLTPFGEPPKNKEDAEIYLNYSYYDISKNIQNILDLYSQSMLPKIREYIEDYQTVLRREVMKEDELNKLARKIYGSHNEAIDFIFENKPDRILEVLDIINEKILKSGWVLASPNKGYSRFLTNNLDKIIPKTGNWYRGKESFVFEIEYCYKKLKFQTVISPGNEENRKILTKALEAVKGSKPPRGKTWIVQFSQKWPYNVEDHTDEEIRKKLDEIWPDIELNVTEVERQLLKLKDSFYYS